jgi:hypothetical protein
VTMLEQTLFTPPANAKSSSRMLKPVDSVATGVYPQQRRSAQILGLWPRRMQRPRLEGSGFCRQAEVVFYGGRGDPAEEVSVGEGVCEATAGKG